MFQKEIYDFIKDNYTGIIIENDRKIIKPLEIDIYIPSHKFAIEYNGSLFHGNPMLFNADDNPSPYSKTITAKEMWVQELNRHKTIFEARGIRTFIVWYIKSKF
jgi:hypothetical protein